MKRFILYTMGIFAVIVVLGMREFLIKDYYNPEYVNLVFGENGNNESICRIISIPRSWDILVC
ncbi:hypothetical protein [Thomasclavelia cocleata]|jgi:hypothetical protein|uniref:hypothetical protein n=1 Tax=Thomasclavelia cocleata TaxID=69824 RepID=UPI0024329CFC|nr:hypothetical protein [Thomasclavelia cocleata]